ncbi:MAG: LysR substrate-binding domain-containing protein [Myxococcota bacterium]
MTQLTRDIWHIPRVMVFLAVAEEGSITAAAKALSLSKGVVSTHLKQLEGVCGARLFERNTRKVALTQAGAAFLPHAHAIRSAWQEGLEELEGQQSEPRGTLVITCSALLARSVLSGIIARYLRAFSKVRVSLRVTDKLVPLLDEGIDVALRAGFLPDSDLVARQLGPIRELVVGVPELCAGLLAPTHPDDLIDGPWVGHPAAQGGRTLYGPDDQEAVLKVASTVDVGDGRSAYELAIAGAGLTFLPRSAVRQALAEGQLIDVLPGWRGPEVPLFAVFPSRKHQTPRVSRFMELLAPVMQRLLVG